MLANDKLPPYKWAIVYFNRFIPFAACFIGLIYLIIEAFSHGRNEVRQLVSYIALMIVAYICREILYQLRERIYKVGESRFYLLLIVFYMSWLMNIFVLHDFNSDIPHYATWQEFFTSFNPFDYIYLKLLVFAPAIGVIWYILDVELDRAKRKDMDIQALLINESSLKKWNQQLVNIASWFFIGVTFIYNIWLGLICLGWILLVKQYPKKYRQLLNLTMGLLCLIWSINFEAEIINTASASLSWLYRYGLWSLIQHESSLKLFKMGLSLIAAPYFIIAAFSEFRLSKKDLYKIKQYAKQEKINKSDEGDIPLGTNAETGELVKLTLAEYNMHALYVGATGSGKTTAILCNVEYVMFKKMPCIILDGKGSPDLPAQLHYMARKYNRPLKIFTLKPEALMVAESLKACIAAYHPFSTGTFTEWKNRIMSLFASADGRGQQHFVINEESALNTVLAILHKANYDIDLKVLFEAMKNIDSLRKIATQINDNTLKQEIEELNAEELGDIAKVLKLFIISSYGALFDTATHDLVIRIQESIINDEIVLFQFDSSAYKEDTKKIAKMVINDLNSAFSTMMERTGKIKKCLCVFDEFASYASNNLSDSLTLQRSNGMHAIVGTQSIETVSLAGVDTARVAEELIACCGTFLILQMQHEKDIERLANLIGTRRTYEVTRQLDMSEGQGATGMGSSKSINEYIIHPDEIRKLKGKDGTGILYRKAYGQEVPIKLILRRAETSSEESQ